MPHYKRCRIPGGTYFFTVNLANRKSELLIEHFDLLAFSVRKVKEAHPFNMRGWVVLPDHLHCIWTLPKGDADYDKRWWAIKSQFTRQYRELRRQTAHRAYADLHGQLQEASAPIWQQRYWEHAIKDQNDFDVHLNYIHINPLKHGHVSRVKDWPHSSFLYLVSRGFYS